MSDLVGNPEDRFSRVEAQIEDSETTELSHGLDSDMAPMI